jgi:hypothetical protein
MIDQRIHHTSCYLNNKVYVIGGQSDVSKNSIFKACEVYDIANNNWKLIASLRIDTITASATVYRNKV